MKRTRLRHISSHKKRYRKTPEYAAYRDMVQNTDKPWCWACGVRDQKIERAHLQAGGGSGVRVEDIRAVNLLCGKCHALHVHQIHAEVYHHISDANMLWIKQSRDPHNWDPEWLQERVWIGKLPIPVPFAVAKFS